MRIAVVGVTGLVGTTILRVLEELKFPVSELIPVASEKSIGKQIYFCKQAFSVVSIEEALETKPQVAIFSAGSSTSKMWAEQFASKGCFVIDNSSAWRMDENVPLIVPEVNGDAIKNHHKIISNPNCSTIQMAVVLSPIYQMYGIKKIVVSTYQSVTGTGVKAVEQLMSERLKKAHEQVYPHPIDLNCFPHGGDFLDNDYTSEEMKLVNETHKILNDNSIHIDATVVRIPVIGGHSESVYIECNKPVNIDDLKNKLEHSNGIVLRDSPEKNEYPTPLNVEGRNEVYVGRIRKGLFSDNSLNLWITADNLRKGAATNAVQIAQLLINKKFI